MSINNAFSLGVRSLVTPVLLLAACLSFAQGFSGADAMRLRASRALEQNPGLLYSPNVVLVKFNRFATADQRSFVRSQIRGVLMDAPKVVEGLEIVGTLIDPVRAVDLLNQSPWVEYAELDYTLRTDAIPNDPNFGVLWGMHNTGQSGGTVDADIDAPEAWDIFTGNPATVVAIIDTGVERTHPDLAANTWINPGEIAGNGVDDDGNGRIDDLYGWDFVNSDNDPMDDNGHGSHVAGTIGGVGNNGIGVVGVNWTVKIAALKFLNASGSGSTSNAVLAVDYCRIKGIKISNNSWGGGGFSQSLFNAINSAGAAGHIFVAAAGNGGPDQVGDNNDVTPHYPSSYNLDNIIAVASITRFDARSSFSNFGATSVDLAAPGSSITSTYRNATYATLSGTSMATPHVTGAVALLWGFRPTWTRQQVRDGILDTVRPTSAMNGITVTGGVLNVQSALAAVGNTAPVVTITAPANGSSVSQGASVTFTGTASDAQQGDMSASLSWTSSLDGPIGSGASFSTSALSVGTHTITASVTDAGGLTGSANVTLTVNAVANTAPTVTITAPANGSSVSQGTSVTFTGTANDAQQGDMSASLSWTSSLDGPIGSGASFSTSTLSVGTHTVTASVTDAGGLTGSANISLTVTSGVTLPAAPSNLSATKLKGGIVNLTWTDNSFNEDGFTIERQTQSGRTWGSTVTFTVGANTTFFSQSPGTGKFRYRVRAFNGAGASAWTAYVTVKI